MKSVIAKIACIISGTVCISSIVTCFCSATCFLQNKMQPFFMTSTLTLSFALKTEMNSSNVFLLAFTADQLIRDRVLDLVGPLEYDICFPVHDLSEHNSLKIDQPKFTCIFNRQSLVLQTGHFGTMSSSSEKIAFNLNIMSISILCFIP